MDDLINSMFGTMNSIQGTMDDLRKRQRVNFAQWVTNMSLAYKIEPEEVINKFYLSLEAIKKSVEGVNQMGKKKKKK